MTQADLFGGDTVAIVFLLSFLCSCLYNKLFQKRLVSALFL